MTLLPVALHRLQLLLIPVVALLTVLPASGFEYRAGDLILTSFGRGSLTTFDGTLVRLVFVAVEDDGEPPLISFEPAIPGQEITSLPGLVPLGGLIVDPETSGFFARRSCSASRKA